MPSKVRASERMQKRIVEYKIRGMLIQKENRFYALFDLFLDKLHLLWVMCCKLKEITLVTNVSI